MLPCPVFSGPVTYSSIVPLSAAPKMGTIGIMSWHTLGIGNLPTQG